MGRGEGADEAGHWTVAGPCRALWAGAKASLCKAYLGQVAHWAFLEDRSSHNVEKHWWQEWLPAVHLEKESSWELMATQSRQRQTEKTVRWESRQDLAVGWIGGWSWGSTEECLWFLVYLLRTIWSFALSLTLVYHFSLFVLLLHLEGKVPYYFKTNNAQSPSALVYQAPQLHFEYIQFEII